MLILRPANINLESYGDQYMKTWQSIFAALVFVMTAAVSGCNTTQGFGQDVEEAGDAIEDAAD
tara:strand:+ start:235 stop:423 length:189 start_codon:yes stop_codon:yes gene_type:complete